jgi:hypothetical protein
VIILGTIERFLITLKSPMLSCFRTNRGPLALGMFFAALLLRGTAILEVEIVRNGNCTGLAEFEPSLTPLTRSWLYGTVCKRKWHFSIHIFRALFFSPILCAHNRHRVRALLLPGLFECQNRCE